MKKRYKFYGKRIVIPSLKLDFDLYTESEDKEQLDLFVNVMLSQFYQYGKGETLKVYDFLGELRSKQTKDTK